MHLYLVSGIGMLSVALIGATLWRWRTGAQWRWFWIGAGVWFVAVVGKVVWSLLINPPLFELMKEHWPTSVYRPVPFTWASILQYGKSASQDLPRYVGAA